MSLENICPRAEHAKVQKSPIQKDAKNLNKENGLSMYLIAHSITDSKWVSFSTKNSKCVSQEYLTLIQIKPNFYRSATSFLPTFYHRLQ